MWVRAESPPVAPVLEPLPALRVPRVLRVLQVPRVLRVPQVLWVPQVLKRVDSQWLQGGRQAHGRQHLAVPPVH